MKKLITVTIAILSILFSAYGADTPLFQSYYCYKSFSSNQYPLTVDNVASPDNVKVYVQDKSMAFVLREEFATHSTIPSTYGYNYTLFYEDYLAYGDQIIYKVVLTKGTVVREYLGTIQITKYSSDFNSINIVQVCNNLSFNAPSNTGDTKYQWWYSPDDVTYTTLNVLVSSCTPTVTGYYKIRSSPYQCRTYDEKVLYIDQVYKNDLNAGNIEQPAGATCDNVSLTINQSQAPSGGNNSYNFQWFQSDDGAYWDQIPYYTNSISFYPKDVKTYLKRKVLSCSSNISAEGTSIQLTKIPGLTSSGQLTADQTICYNTVPVQLKGTSATGGGTVTYLWQSSTDSRNWTDIQNSNQLNYSPGILTAKTYYQRQSNSTCGNSTSNLITITVLPIMQDGTLSTNPTTICNGATPNQIIGTDATGANGYSYKWSKSLDGVQYDDISNTNNKSYTPGVLSTSTSFKRSAISTCGTLLSQPITITVNPVLTVGTIADNQEVCPSGTVSAISGQASSGGDGNLSYQWFSSTDQINWTIIVNASSKDYTPNPLTVNTYFRRKTLSATCGEGLSNSVSVIVKSTISANTITASQTICNSSSPSKLNGNAISNATFNWEKSTDASNWSTIPIAIANQSSYQPDPLTTSTYFRRKVITECANNSSEPVYIQVYPIPSTPIIASKNIYCSGEKITLTPADQSVNYLWLDYTGILKSTDFTYSINNIQSTDSIYVRSLDSRSCKSDIQKIILKVDNVNADFTADLLKINSGNAVKFTNNSVNAISYSWSFSEGEKSTSKNPVKYFYQNGYKTIRLYATSTNGCIDSLIKENYITVGTVTPGTGIDNVSNDDILIYPNPVKDRLNIELGADTKHTTVQLINISGILVKELFNFKETFIDFSDIPAGLYVLVITTDSKTITFKIVKQ